MHEVSALPPIPAPPSQLHPSLPQGLRPKLSKHGHERHWERGQKRPRGGRDGGDSVGGLGSGCSAGEAGDDSREKAQVYLEGLELRGRAASRALGCVQHTMNCGQMLLMYRGALVLFFFWPSEGGCLLRSSISHPKTIFEETLEYNPINKPTT